MAYGVDTDELLRRVANIQHNVLDVSNLNITSLPPLPSGLQRLICYNTHLTRLPDLPSGLEALWCSNTLLTSLPDLPSNLYRLSCHNTPLITLPTLPSGLEVLDCYNTHLTTLPDLPSNLETLYCNDTHLITLPDLPSGLLRLTCCNRPISIRRRVSEGIREYHARLREEYLSKRRSQERCSVIKEDLVAEVWHPKRLEKLLDLGGWDLVETLI